MFFLFVCSAIGAVWDEVTTTLKVTEGHTRQVARCGRVEGDKEISSA